MVVLFTSCCIRNISEVFLFDHKRSAFIIVQAGIFWDIYSAIRMLFGTDFTKDWEANALSP